MTTLRISGFDHALDNAPDPADVTWEQLLDALRAPRAAECAMTDKCWEGECQHKKFGQAWSPASWPEGELRAKATVEAVSLLVVDVDHVPSDDELCAIYARVEPWRHVVHASHSDRPTDRCIRVILAVSRPMTAAEFPRVRSAVLEMLELPGDRRTSDASRIFYAPSRPSDACGDKADGTGYLFIHGDGKVLDVDAILAAVADEPEYDYSQTEFLVPDFEGAPPAEKLEEAARILAGAWPDDDRHQAQLALAGALARAGWPVGLIADFCARVAEIDEPGNPKHVRLAPGAARSSVAKVHRGDNVAGWPTVVEYCGDEAVSRARFALGLASGPVSEALFAGMAQRVRRQTEAKAQTPPPSAPREMIAQYAAPDAPTQTEIDATLTAARKRLTASKRAHDIADAQYIKKMLAGDVIVDPREYFEATMAVVRHAPPNITDDQIRNIILGSNRMGSEPEIVRLAREGVAEAQEQRAARDRVAREEEAQSSDFTLVKTGPRTGQRDNKQHNLAVALRRLGCSLSYDELADQEIIEYRDPSDPDGEVYRKPVEDSDVNALFLEFEKQFEIYAEDGYFTKWVGVEARKNAYHPVRDYFDTLDPDVDLTDLTETWLIRYGGAEDTPFVREISRIVVVAAVRRIRQPGCKFDEMLILEGDQGLGKSTLLKVLARNPEWFTDNFDWHVDDKKQFIEQISGKWIVESGELSNMSKSDHRNVKKVITQTEDRARMSYGRRVRTYKRQCIIIGTTNDDEYLVDPTGNRRYWPVVLSGPIDLEGFRAVVDQLWAEACRLERENPQESYIRLSPKLYEAASREQSKREVETAYRVRLTEALDGAHGMIKVQDVWKLLGFDENGNPNQPQMNAIASEMRRLGFKKEPHQVGGCRANYYVRGDGPSRRTLLRVVLVNNAYQVKATPSVMPASSAAPPLPALSQGN